MEINQIQTPKPHFIFFPFMAHGHMIPLLDIAKLFASRNLKITILTTHLNQPLVSRQIQKTINSDLDINVHLLKFPNFEVGLPENCENLDFITSKNLGWEAFDRFSLATPLLQEQVDKLLEEIHPDCLVADMLFPWTTDSASKFGIPRLVFHGTCLFALCASMSVEEHQPHKKVESDSELFVLPNLPGDIKMSRKQIPSSGRMETENETMKLFKLAREADVKSYGVVVNSFYELEPAYSDHYRNVLGRKVWNIGPVSLCNKDVEDKVRRGYESSINEHECLQWLDSKKPNSVVYICFGTISNFNAAQLKEIAAGLESSNKHFIWVIRRREEHEQQQQQNWLPKGFEERMKGKGLIIRGWAPQVLMLEHEAVGGFVTHCGWNSTLEAIASGLPMVTWPVGAEQFYNEKLVTQVLKIGVSVDDLEWTIYGDSIVKSECVEKAVNQIMEGEKAEEMRNKAKEFGEMAKKAVEEGGSSYSNISNLIQEIISDKWSDL